MGKKNRLFGKRENSKPVEEPPKQVQLTAENAPLLGTKYLELILIEMRKLNKYLETHNG